MTLGLKVAAFVVIGFVLSIAIAIIPSAILQASVEDQTIISRSFAQCALGYLFFAFFRQYRTNYDKLAWTYSIIWPVLATLATLIAFSVANSAPKVSDIKDIDWGTAIAAALFQLGHMPLSVFLTIHLVNHAGSATVGSLSTPRTLDIATYTNQVGRSAKTLLKLIFACFIVGLIFAVFGIDPMNLWRDFGATIRDAWTLAFDAVNWSWQYAALGAIVVLPVWIIYRIILAVTGKPRG